MARRTALGNRRLRRVLCRAFARTAAGTARHRIRSAARSHAVVGRDGDLLCCRPMAGSVLLEVGDPRPGSDPAGSSSCNWRAAARDLRRLQLGRFGEGFPARDVFCQCGVLAGPRWAARAFLQGATVASSWVSRYRVLSISASDSRCVRQGVARIRSCAGVRTTNVAFGGPDNKSLFITEAEHGVILHARLDLAVFTPVNE